MLSSFLDEELMARQRDYFGGSDLSKLRSTISKFEENVKEVFKIKESNWIYCALINMMETKEWSQKKKKVFPPGF